MEQENNSRVFLHGKPTSPGLRRYLLPQLEGRGRLIAVFPFDRGDSDKLSPDHSLRCSFPQPSNFLDQLLEQLGVKENATLAVPDGGFALGSQ